jgi:AhpD family alkylhydroperoxidase
MQSKMGDRASGLTAPHAKEILAGLEASKADAADPPTYGAHVLSELAPKHRNLRHVIPDVYAGFGALSQAAVADGALDHRTKELIAFAIAVVEGCDGCIAAHARAAARAGATREEAAEAIGVAILMHGGPARNHGARAYEAFCAFADSPA